MTTRLPRRQLLTGLFAIPAVAVLAAACGDSGSGQTSTSAAAASGPVPPSRGTVNMDRLLEEGALPDRVLGEEDAPVTIVEYLSMTCIHCANFHNNTLPEIKERYIDTGQARLIMREFPFDPRAEAGAMLARCADTRYHAMVDVLFRQYQNWVQAENARDALLQISRVAGFSQESFEACLTDQQLLNDVRAVRSRGQEDFGVDSTPTFFINGNKYSGALSVDEMSAIIESHL
ncbi:MAG: DsbA family protein [Rhizobiaceae bacterium]